VSRQGGVVIQATRDFTVKTVQKAADLALQAGRKLYTDSASSYRAVKGYGHDFVNHTEIGLTHVTCQFYNLLEDLSARLEYLEGFGEEVIQKLAA
jgi:hypothetical protein